MDRPWVSRLVIAAVVIGVVVASILMLRGGDQPLPVHGDGLADTHDGFQLVTFSLPQQRGDAVPLAFRIVDKSNKPLTRYDEHRGHRLHLYLTRDDMQAYQHVYPELKGATWHAKVSVPLSGQYRVYAEFVPRVSAEMRHPIRIGVPFTVPGDSTYVPLPAPAARVDDGGVTVTRSDGDKPLRMGHELTLRFRVDGSPPQPHLGGYGELVALSSASLAMLHVRPADGAPENGELAFQVTFAEPGQHRLMLEIRTGGKTRLVGFTVLVK